MIHEKKLEAKKSRDTVSSTPIFFPVSCEYGVVKIACHRPAGVI
jgi:hypothetical protein